MHSLGNHAAELKERFVGEVNFGHGRVTIGKVVAIPPHDCNERCAKPHPGGCGFDSAIIGSKTYFTAKATISNPKSLSVARTPSTYTLAIGLAAVTIHNRTECAERKGNA
jgi:hypothetical protein